MKDLQIFVTSGEIIGIIVMAILYIKSRLPKETIEQQGKLIEVLQKRLDEIISENKSLADKHFENEKGIADLQGQIKVYKELPLRDIARSMKALENLPKEFQRISKINTKEIKDAVHNIKEQHVQHQTVDKEVVKHKQ